MPVRRFSSKGMPGPFFINTAFTTYLSNIDALLGIFQWEIEKNVCY